MRVDPDNVYTEGSPPVGSLVDNLGLEIRELTDEEWENLRVLDEKLEEIRGLPNDLKEAAYDELVEVLGMKDASRRG